MTIHHDWTQQLVNAVDLSLGHHTFGKSPVFPLEAWTQAMKKLLRWDDLSIHLEGADYVKGDGLLRFAGANPTIIALELAPLKAPFFISMSHDDLMMLASLLTTSDFSRTFHESEIKKGFLKFIFARMVLEFKQLNPYRGLSLRFSDEPLTPHEAYVQEISVKVHHKEAFLKLIIPLEFQRLFRQHFEKQIIPLHERLNFSTLSCELNCQMGTVELSRQQLKNLKVSDTVLLDQYSFQPKTKKGYFKLCYRDHPLFQVKIKEDQIKLLDYIQQFKEPAMSAFDEEHLDDRMSDLSHPSHEEYDEDMPEAADAAHEELINPDQVPFTLTVETGRFEMNLNALLELKPGSVIPLSKRPEEGVYLTLNNKKVARGELVQLGDTVGVKILQLY